MSIIKIVGSNISSIVLACELIDQKIDFEFYPTSRNLGSGWGGLLFDEQILDLGQRYFELEFENTIKRDLGEFEICEGHRDFVHHVRNFIEKYHPINLAKVETYFKGVILKCPLETVNLEECFKLFSDQEKLQIIEETSEKTYNRDLNFETIKQEGTNETDYNLLKILQNSHSNLLNESLIFPFVSKFGIPLEQVPYGLRRKLWCPLFYRSTVIEAAREELSFEPFRPHFSIINSSTSKLIQTLIKKLQNSTGWKDDTRAQKYFRNDFYHDLKSYPNLVLATSIDWLSDKLYIKPNKDYFLYRLIWISLHSADVKIDVNYLSVIDQDIPFFRVSGSSNGKKNEKIFCIELTDKFVDIKRIVSDLKCMNIISKDAKPRLLKDLSVNLESPTFHNKNVHTKAIAQILDRYPKLNLDLSAAVFGKNTFNDQVLLGLKRLKEIINEKTGR